MTIRAAIGKTRATTGSAVLERAARALLAGTCLLLACCTGTTDPQDAAQLALWRIVDHACNGTPAAPATAAPPAGPECLPSAGAAVLKDRCGSRHYLLIPTARRSGVESPQLVAPGEPNYFSLAWSQRARSSGGPAGAGADIALAVNSRYGRSQDQLHVHIDQLRPEVRATLDALALPLAPQAAIELLGHRYRVALVDSLDANLFGLAFAQWSADDAAARARIGIAVAAASQGRYFVLSDRADLWRLDRGHAEELLVPRACAAPS